MTRRSRSLRWAALSAALLVAACVSFAPHPKIYYLSATPYTFSDSTADSATVHLGDWVEVQLNASISYARLMGHETGGCLRIAKHDGRRVFWIDSIETAQVIGMPSPATIRFICPKGTGAFHTHPYQDGDGWECTVSSMDTSPGNATTPVELMICGFGVDSVTAYTVRPRRDVPRDTTRDTPDVTEIARRAMRVLAHRELLGKRE